MGGLGNKVYCNGDVVTADCFDTPVEKLIAGGWLVPIDEDGAAAAKQAELDAKKKAEEEATEGTPLLDQLEGNKKK